LLIALPAAAMGVQTVTVTRVGSLRVYTTYLTGNLSKFAEAVVGYVFWLVDQWRQDRSHPGLRPTWKREAKRHRLLGHALLTSGLWVAFLLGAWGGDYDALHVGVHALAWPIVALAALVVLDAKRPVAAVEENEPLGFER